MTFLWPNMLYLLVLVPLLVLAYLLVIRRRRATALRYGNLDLLRAASAHAKSFRRHVPPILFLAAVTSLIFSLSRPATTLLLPSEHGTVILAMDISGSMRATDIDPSRLEASRVAARAFVQQQPRNVRIGIVVFAGGAALVQAPTLNREDVLAAIGRYQTQMGTAVGSGILASIMAIFEDLHIDVDLPEISRGRGFGRQGLALPAPGSTPLAGTTANGQPSTEPRLPDPVPPGSYTSAVVVLLTDGQTTQGPDPIAAAQIAADLGLRVYTVGLGTEAGAVLSFFGRSMRVQLDEATLQTIADRTHAQYFHADSETHLEQIYRTLSSQLVLEKEQTEITAIFAGIGALLIVIAALLSLLWFHRLA